MWTNILMSDKKEDVTLLKDSLKNLKILVRVRKFLGENGVFYKVLVPRAELNEALNLIIDLNL